MRGPGGKWWSGEGGEVLVPLLVESRFVGEIFIEVDI